MDTGAIFGGIFNNPGFTALLGVVVGWMLDGIRRAEDRRQRWIDRQQETITALQYGLLGMLKGDKMSQGTWFQGEIRARMAGHEGGIPAFMDAVPTPAKEAWHQEWHTAIQTAAIMVYRIQDAELQRLSLAAIVLSQKLQDVPYNEFTKRFPELEAIVASANERAGEVYRELEAGKPAFWHRWFGARPTHSVATPPKN